MAETSAIAQLQSGALDFGNGGKMSKQEARKAAESFESVFLSQFLSSMFKGIKAGGPFGNGPGAEVYRSMLNKEYATSIAQQGGIGIADQVYSELLKAQEAASNDGQ